MYTVRRPVDNLYLVRERDRGRSRELLAFLLAALLPTAVLFGAIWANLETFRLGYQVERLQKQRETLTERHRQLLLEKAQASALSRVDAIARGRLGLVPPRPEQLVTIRDGSLVTPPEPPAPARPAIPSPREAAAGTVVGPPAPPRTEEGF